MSLMQLLYYGFLCIFVIINIVLTVFSMKKDKSKNSTNEAGNQNNGNDSKTIFQEIVDRIPSYVRTAEKIFNNMINPQKKLGEERKGYVLDKLKVDCMTSGVTYNEEYFTSRIKDIVDTTKEVNKSK